MNFTEEKEFEFKEFEPGKTYEVGRARRDVDPVSRIPSDWAIESSLRLFTGDEMIAKKIPTIADLSKKDPFSLDRSRDKHTLYTVVCQRQNERLYCGQFQLAPNPDAPVPKSTKKQQTNLIGSNALMNSTTPGEVEELRARIRSLENQINSLSSELGLARGNLESERKSHTEILERIEKEYSARLITLKQTHEAEKSLVSLKAKKEAYEEMEEMNDSEDGNLGTNGWLQAATTLAPIAIEAVKHKDSAIAIVDHLWNKIFPSQLQESANQGTPHPGESDQ